MLLPDLINTAKLSLQARNTGSNLLQCIFLARELILQDGFSRMCPLQIFQKLAAARSNLIISTSLLRLGQEGLVGADNLDSSVMDLYKNVMYQVYLQGCHSLVAMT